jgi:putative ABC transport system substrate-binding protein
VALALALLACRPAVEAQQVGKVGRVGFLYFGSRQTGLGPDRYAAFLDGMRALGYIEGKTVIVEARFAESKPERLSGLAEDLLRLKVDVIVATGSPVYRVLQRMTGVPPVVITVTNDPVLEGLAASLARPARAAEIHLAKTLAGGRPIESDQYLASPSSEAADPD